MTDLQTLPNLDALSLDDLAVIAKREHAEIVDLLASVKTHAVLCGQALIAARGHVVDGDWLRWVEDNCAISAGQAAFYMKVARHAHLIPENATWAEMQAATRGLQGPFAKEKSGWVSDVVEDELKHLKRQIRKMRKQGMSYTAIAKETGHSRDTIRKAIFPKETEFRRKIRQTDAAEARKLLADKRIEQGRKHAAAKAGGNTARLYELLHKSLDVVDLAIGEALPHNREHARACRDHIHLALSELAKALGRE